MTITKIIQNGKTLNYTAYSDILKLDKPFYNLNFMPVCNHFGIKLGDTSTLLHYNKFEKRWGMIDVTTGHYQVLEKERMHIDATPEFLLLPDDVSPKALIRGVLLYRLEKLLAASTPLPKLEIPSVIEFKDTL